MPPTPPSEAAPRQGAAAQETPSLCLRACDSGLVPYIQCVNNQPHVGVRGQCRSVQIYTKIRIRACLCEKKVPRFSHRWEMMGKSRSIHLPDTYQTPTRRLSVACRSHGASGQKIDPSAQYFRPGAVTLGMNRHLKRALRIALLLLLVAGTAACGGSANMHKHKKSDCNCPTF